MASFRKIFSPDPRGQELHTDLKDIGYSVTTENLFKLFKAKVYRLTRIVVRASVKLAGQGSSLEQVLTCVGGVKREIVNGPKIVVQAGSTIAQFIPQMKSLRDGLARLNDIKDGIYDDEEGDDAEERDRALIKQAIQSANNMEEDLKDSIILYNMRNPLVDPYKITSNRTCKDVRNYLKYDEGVKKPDLWRERKHDCNRTRQVLCWEYVANRAEILPALALQYVDLNPDFNPYTVVLWRHIRKKIDTPVAIQIPILGTNLSLRQHLENVRPGYTVQRVRKIDNVEDVTTRIVDMALCRHRMNDLLVRVNKVGDSRWARWRERWRVARERWMRSRVRGYSIG